MNTGLEHFQAGYELAWFDLRNGIGYRNEHPNEIQAAGYDFGRVLYRTPVSQCYAMWLESLGLVTEQVDAACAPVLPDTDALEVVDPRARTNVVKLFPSYRDAI